MRHWFHIRFDFSHKIRAPEKINKAKIKGREEKKKKRLTNNSEHEIKAAR